MFSNTGQSFAEHTFQLMSLYLRRLSTAHMQLFVTIDDDAGAAQ